jgi:hypothetical protein
MSEVETHLGKLIPIGKKLTLDVAVDMLDGKYDFELDVLDNFYEFFYNKYYVDTNNNIYYVDDIELENESILNATKNEDESINYLLQYNNGGCSFTEALDYALKNIKNND